MSRYRCVDARKAEQFPVAAACEAAGISTSAYYAWVASCARGPAAAELATRQVVAEIRAIHADSDGVYGSPLVTAELRRRGQQVNHKRVERLMRALELVGHRPRRRRSLTKPDTSTSPAPDLLGRLFDPDQPNVAWCGDITCIPTDEGWLYLASVIDLASRHLIGWSMSDRHDAGLVTGALEAASPPAARASCPAQSSTPTGVPSTPQLPARTPASGLGCASRWAAPAPAWTMPPRNLSSRPWRWSSSVVAATAPAPKHAPRSSPGSPGTTDAGCTRPSATCPGRVGAVPRHPQPVTVHDGRITRVSGHWGEVHPEVPVACGRGCLTMAPTLVR